MHEPQEGFCEREECQFHIFHDRPCTLLIDDVELACTSAKGRHEWAWTPGFYAGIVFAELLDESGALLASYELDVAPDQNKLGRFLFQEMVSQLVEADPLMLFGAEAARHRIGTEGYVTSPHLEYARLKKFGPMMLRALRMLSTSPLAHLRYEREWRQPHAVRKMDQQSLRSMVNLPAAISLLYERNEHSETIEGAKVLFNVSRSIESFDTPAHRTLMLILHSVMARARLVSEKLKAIANKENPSDVRSAMTPRLDIRLKFLFTLEMELRHLCRHRPFDQVRRKEISSAGLTVIAGSPVYAEAFRSALRILRPGLLGQKNEETLPISPTWEIYERWCFIAIYRALQLIFPEVAWIKSYPSARSDNILFVGHTNGTVINLHFQPRFPAMDNKGSHTFWSISGERVPDIVLTCSRKNFRTMLVFDAKYRVSRQNVLDAMSSAHLYRDSLRWDGQSPDISVLLVPASGGVPWLESDEFLSEHAVGVIPLSSQIEIQKLVSTLKLQLFPKII